MIKYLLPMAVFAVLALPLHAQKNTEGYLEYTSECINAELDGTLTMRAYGRGRNRRDAIEQAKKNAVNDVLFINLRTDNRNCLTGPVAGSLAARRQHEDYFNMFFRDGGPYTAYVRKDERFLDQFRRVKKHGDRSITFEIVVTVDLPLLRQDLRAEGIIE